MSKTAAQVGSPDTRGPVHRARRSVGVVVVALILASCSGPAASAAPSTTPTAPATAAPTASPSSTPSPSPSVATTLKVEWNREEVTGIDKIDGIVGVVRAGGTYVLVVSLPHGDNDEPSSAAWWSDDGLSWTLAQDLPGGTWINAVTAGGPGFVAAGVSDDGSPVWTSVDGHAWEPVSDD